MGVEVLLCLVCDVVKLGVFELMLLGKCIDGVGVG